MLSFILATMFTLTAYCPCEKCCGNWADFHTSTGHLVDYGVIAVDPEIIPLKSVVHIQGLGYFVALDTGSKIKGYKIDLFIPSHEEALKFGVQHRDVEIVLKARNKQHAKSRGP